MLDLREIIGKNIAELRLDSEMTQQRLADILNYSDKAVSKWERGEALPDISVLKQIADIFGVSVDYLLSETHNDEKSRAKKITKNIRRNRFLITLLAISLVWLVATLAFVIFENAFIDSKFHWWIVFIYAVPVSTIVILVFNSVWGIGKFNFLIISVMVWSVLLSIHLTALLLWQYNAFLIYVLGIPAQVIILLWSGINMKND